MPERCARCGRFMRLAWCETHDETFPLGETCPFNTTVREIGDHDA